ncbi:MAG: O-methyltransferase [Bacteroidota bacterium]
MEITEPRIQAYCEQHSSPESPALAKLNRDTHAKVLNPRMLSGHLQGRFLSAISCMIKPYRILEIGTYTGYSTLCLAEGLNEGGHIISIEQNDELQPVHQRIFETCGYDIRMLYGDAKQLLTTIEDSFDLVFMDADKSEYDTYLNLIEHVIKPGSWIVVDNVLWDGHVLEQDQDRSEETRSIQRFNEKVRTNPDFEVVMLPVRDGLSLIRRL